MKVVLITALPTITTLPHNFLWPMNREETNINGEQLKKKPKKPKQNKKQKHYLPLARNKMSCPKFSFLFNVNYGFVPPKKNNNRNNKTRERGEIQMLWQCLHSLKWLEKEV